MPRSIHLTTVVHRPFTLGFVVGLALTAWLQPIATPPTDAATPVTISAPSTEAVVET